MFVPLGEIEGSDYTAEGKSVIAVKNPAFARGFLIAIVGAES